MTNVTRYPCEACRCESGAEHRARCAIAAAHRRADTLLAKVVDTVDIGYLAAGHIILGRGRGSRWDLSLGLRRSRRVLPKGSGN